MWCRRICRRGRRAAQSVVAPVRRGLDAAAVEAYWNGPLEGLVVTRYGHGVQSSISK